MDRHCDVLSGDLLNEAAELSASGSSVAAAGAHFGLDARTVQRTFKRAGIPRRSRSGR